MRRLFCTAGLLTLVGPAAIVFGEPANATPVTFTVLIESVTTPETLKLADGSAVAAPISPGLYVVSNRPGELFKPGGNASPGLERLAEDGDPAALIEEINVRAAQGIAIPFLHNQSFMVQRAILLGLAAHPLATAHSRDIPSDCGCVD